MNREQAAAQELARLRAAKTGAGRMILAIDPGTATSGVALLEDGRPVILRIVRSRGKRITERIADMARQLGEIVRQNRHRADTLAVEWQAIRPTDKNPNDILHLAMICGAALANASAEQTILTPLPVSWKGSIDGDEFTQRVCEWFANNLPPVEGGPPSLHHNAYDALGLAAWAINQRQPWRT